MLKALGWKWVGDHRSESLQEALWLAVLLYKGLNRVTWYMLT